jgi:regulator of cell morphogenesis and NO signaling
MTVYASDVLIGDIVTADPSRARILERFGIDYCCGGREPLSEVCAWAGVDLDELLTALNAQPGPPADWAGFDDAALVEHIVDTHHRFLWDEFPRLSATVDKVARVHGGNHEELTRVQSVFEQLRAGVEPHLRNEETALFPAIVALERATQPVVSEELRAALHDNIVEHDDAGALLAELHELTDGYRVPDDACATYTAMLAGLAEIESDLHMHVHKENNVLYPRVLASA